MGLPSSYQEQPDLRCCASCNHSYDDAYSPKGLYCNKYEDYVIETNICDTWEESW